MSITQEVTNPCATIITFTNVPTGATSFSVPLACSVKGEVISNPTLLLGPTNLILSTNNHRLIVTSPTAITSEFNFTYNLTTTVNNYTITQVVFVPVVPIGSPITSTCNNISANFSTQLATIVTTQLTCSCQSSQVTPGQLQAVSIVDNPYAGILYASIVSSNTFNIRGFGVIVLPLTLTINLTMETIPACSSNTFSFQVTLTS